MKGKGKAGLVPFCSLPLIVNIQDDSGVQRKGRVGEGLLQGMRIFRRFSTPAKTTPPPSLPLAAFP